MPGGIFSGGFGNIADQGTNTGTSTGTTLTASGTAHVKGSYSQIVASTPNDASGFLLSFGNPSTASPFIIDVAIGAAGSEIVLVPNFVVDVAFSAFASLTIFVPCAIPAGSRVAVRCQCGAGSATLCAQVTILDGNPSDIPSCGLPLAYGVNTGTTTGTLVSVGSANTKSAWVELTSSTSRDISLLHVNIEKHSSAGNDNYLVDVGIGAAGSEKILIPNIMCGLNYTVSFGALPLFHRQIPAGSRLAARLQCAGGSNYLGVSLLGYPQ